MTGAKYYVWASGAWREVQASGRVAGWQRRARFLFVRRGRLQLAPRGVLRALAAHAAGEPSAVRDGARLSQRSYVHGYRGSRAPVTGERPGCHDAHNKYKGSMAVSRRAAAPAPAPAADTADSSTQCVARADASTQASPTQARAATLNIHLQKKDTTDEDFQRKPTLASGPRTRNQRRAGGRPGRAGGRSSSSSDITTHFITATTVANIENDPQKNIKSPTKKEKLAESDGSDESDVTVKIKGSAVAGRASRSPGEPAAATLGARPRPGPRPRPRPAADAHTSDDGVKVIYDRAKTRRKRPGRTAGDAAEHEPGPKRPRIDDHRKSLRHRSKTKPTATTREPVVENLSDTTDSDETRSTEVSDDSDDSDAPTRAAALGDGRRARARRLELVIPERDVDVLREFVARTRCADLYQFDADDDYKRSLFYSINPVVDVERCARLERALRDRALRRFTEGLGLRSVSEASTRATASKSGITIGKTSRSVSSDDDSAEGSESGGSRGGGAARRGDRSRGGPRRTAVSRDRNMKMSNKTNVLGPELTRDDSEDASKQLNNERTRTLRKRQSINEAKTMRSSSKNTSKESANDATKKINNKIIVHTAEHNSDSSEDIKTKRGVDRTSRSRAKKLTNELSSNKPATAGDSSEDTAKEPNKSRTKKSSKKTYTHKSTRDRSEDIKDKTSGGHIEQLKNKPRTHQSIIIRDSSEDSTEALNKSKTKKSKKPNTYNPTSDSSEDPAEEFAKDKSSRTKKSSKKPSVRRSGSTGDSSDDTEDSTSRSRTKKLSTKGHQSASSGDSSEHEHTTGRGQTDKPGPHKSGTARDSSEDNEERNIFKSKKAANKPRARGPQTAGSERTWSKGNNNKINNMLATVKGKKNSQKQTAAGPGAECKENVPLRANRMRGVAAGDGGSGEEVGESEGEEEEEGEGELSTSREALMLAARTSHTISKRPSSWGAKEYSNLEDHAIVAWVSGGARARRVNGNVVWRQLQDQYPALTGKKRSWHSLRNRYLRYILPALGALRLPPAHAARLRAAAATGEHKGKKAAQAYRRNSIFDKEPPANGAASRRPRPAPPTPAPPSPAPAPAPPTDEDAPSTSSRPPRRSLRSSGAAPAPAPAPASPPAVAAPAPAPRSPRYSDVTRQFASRKLRSTPRSSVTSPRDPDPPPPASPPSPPATRTRRLFNPNALL